MSENPNVIPRRPDGSFLEIALEATQAAIESILAAILAEVEALNTQTAGLATESTLTQIRVSADNLDIPLSSLTKPSDQQHVAVDNWPPGIGGDLIEQKRYDIRDDAIYVGKAALGVAAASPAWTIQKIDFDVNGNPTQSRWTSAGVAWDSRESETYT